MGKDIGYLKYLMNVRQHSEFFKTNNDFAETVFSISIVAAFILITQEVSI